MMTFSVLSVEDIAVSGSIKMHPCNPEYMKNEIEIARRRRSVCTLWTAPFVIILELRTFANKNMEPNSFQ
jgi:hypothetical protein